MAEDNKGAKIIIALVIAGAAATALAFAAKKKDEFDVKLNEMIEY